MPRSQPGASLAGRALRLAISGPPVRTLPSSTASPGCSGSPFPVLRHQAKPESLSAQILYVQLVAKVRWSCLLFSFKSFIVLALTLGLCSILSYFLYMVRSRVQIHSFACKHPVILAPFSEKTVLSSLSYLGTFV